MTRQMDRIDESTATAWIEMLVQHGYLERVTISRTYPVAGVTHEKVEVQVRGPLVVIRDTERGVL